MIRKFSLSHHLSKRWVLLMIVVMWLCINLLSYLFFPRVRIDLTEEKLFTLSPFSSHFVSELNEPITIYFFYSENTQNNPVIQRYAVRVKSLLQQFHHASDGTISLKFVNPKPFSKEEDLAIGYGIQPIPIDNYSSQLYFGLSITNHRDDVLTIPFLNIEKEQFLEYELTKTLHDLVHPEQTELGILSSIPTGYYYKQEDKVTTIPWAVINQIDESYNIKVIDHKDTSIPESLDLLMVVQPYNLSKSLIYALDQYIVNGGKVIIFADPFPESQDFSTYTIDKASAFNTLIESWGLVIDHELVVGDKKLATSITKGNDQSQQHSISYLPWLTLNKEHFSKQHPTVSGLEQIQLAGSGFIQPINPQGYFEPFIYSSDESMPLAVEQVKRASPDELLMQFKSENIQYILAAHLSDTIDSAFEKKLKGAKSFHKKATDPAEIMIVADTDLLQDRFWVQSKNEHNQQLLLPYMDNSSLLLNMLDVLSGREAFVQLRSKPILNRPFTVINDLQQRAENTYLAKRESLKEALNALEIEQHHIESSSAEDGMLLSPSQHYQLTALRKRTVSLRQELRHVQHSLKKEIESLALILKIVGIGAMPLVVTLLAGIIWLRRYRHQSQKILG